MNKRLQCCKLIMGVIAALLLFYKVDITSFAMTDTTWQNDYKYELDGNEILLRCYQGGDVDEKSINL